MGKRLLVIDSSYSLEAIRKNGIEASVTCRDLGGYFERVWTVHPFATLVTSSEWSPRFGAPEETVIDARNVFIEGKVARYERLAPLPPLNFLLAQSSIMRRLLRLVREERVSAVRAGDPLLMGLYGLAIARAADIPLVVRVPQNFERARQATGRPILPRFFRSVRLERGVERAVLARADLVAAANEDYRRASIALGAVPERTTVFRYGNIVDRAHVVPPRDRAPATADLEAIGVADRRFILCIGRLAPVKMPDHALRAHALMRANGLDVVLLMVGGGPMRDELEALARSLGTTKHVVFAGDRPQDWLARVIPTASAVLSPLTGRALVEVAFGAAATVAYDVDWHGELIRTGVNGILVPLGDIAALAAGASRLVVDDAAAREMGQRLRADALETMSHERLDAHERAQLDAMFARARKH